MAAKAAGAMPPPPEPAGRAPPIAVSSLNPNLVAAEYAVRGEIVLRAQQIARDLEAGVGGYGFERTVACNIGNPQVLGQKPITFFRQVLALCECPALLEEPRVTELFPPDAVERARTYLAGIPGGLGAYSESAGVPSLRASIAAALVRRDGGVAATRLGFREETAMGGARPAGSGGGGIAPAALAAIADAGGGAGAGALPAPQRGCGDPTCDA